jgi:DMSO/TMAO reductase YedYZ molybdopterin-dependent catalytic subunit
VTVTKQYRLAALAGIAAAAVALAVGELVALIVSSRSAPLVAVGGLVIDRVPEGTKELAIQLFGTKDKLALQVGTVLVLLGIAALLGIASLRRLWIGLVGIAAFGVVGIAAALSRTGATVAWVFPSLVGALAAGAVLVLLVRLLASTDESKRNYGTDRRRFLTTAWLALGGAAVVGVAGRMLSELATTSTARGALTLPTPTGRPALSPPGADVAGLSYVTDNGQFYRIDTALVVPRIDPADWTLKIHGRVRHPLTLTMADLLKRPMVERYITLCCVSNEVGGELIGNARWLGVPVQDLLDEVDPEDGADQVVGRSADGFTAGTPTKVLRDGRDALIAIGMNGEPLPFEHGFPVRMVVPGLYGYVSATKWLTELELTTFADFDAYWIPRGWAQMAPIKTESRIDKPRPGQMKAGPTVIAGVAWAQHRGISKVEVRVDDGPWQVATLAEVASVDTWRLWSLPWDAPRGDHTLVVRATDNAGELQTPNEVDPPPDGATGWHTIGVSVA